MKRLMNALIAAGVLALPAFAQADSTVFRWVDSNGVTNYTTTPPPSNSKKVAAINASPAINSIERGPYSEEAEYWRNRRMREAANDMASARQARDSAALREAQMRQQLASQYDEDQRRKAEDVRRQAAYERCQREVSVYCNNVAAGGDPYGYGTTVVVAGGRSRQGIQQAAPFPVPGSPLVTNPTPGAPSLSGNPTPGAPSIGLTPSRPASRPAVAARLGNNR